MQRNGFSFNGQNIYVGIDVHLKTWSVAIMTETGVLDKFSQESDAGTLYAHLCRKYPGGSYYSVYESGFTGFSTHYMLESVGIKNMIVNAADVPVTQRERVYKTDKVDAQRLVENLRRQKLTPNHIPDPVSISQRELVRARATLVKDISRWKVRIKHLLYRNGVKYPQLFENNRSHWSRRFIQWMEEEVTLLSPQGKKALMQHIATYKLLRAQLLGITKEIRLMSRTEKYKTNMELMLSIPGIGFLSAVTLLTEIGDVSRFANEKEFAAYIGLVPMCHDSGETVSHGEITFRGNKQMKSILVESAWIAIRKDLALSACFSNYCKKMESNKAIIRIARKLSNRIITVLKRKEKYMHERNDQQ